ncbi:helix-turn-helix domain-containing protein [Streptomyces anandii]|uniref:helix-turn-helix domain-containing protein n=1 Tax=Streptomyces anandii TaxID=285454 RepID=UPI0037A442BA
MATLWKRAKALGDENVADVAERAGVSESTLYRLAAGRIEPSLTTLWALRGAYGGRLDSLVYDDPQAARRTSVPRQRARPAPSQRQRNTS